MTKPFAIYAITVHGIALGERLQSAMAADLYVSERLWSQAPEGAIRLPLPMGPALAETFAAYDCHVFVFSVGAAVRLVAPLLVDKKSDPAVVCVDDAARWSICVLSGHVGRGNEFAQQVAGVLGAEAVVSTASDVRGTLPVDILGRALGWTVEDPHGNLARAAAAVVNASPVLFVQETGEPEWWPLDRPLPEGVRYATALEGADPRQFAMVLIVTDRLVEHSHPELAAQAVVYRPKSLVLGLGCDKGTPVELVEAGIRSLLESQGLAIASVKEIATIDIKQNEPALLEISRKFGWPMRTFSADELAAVAGIENPSETVKKHVGTPAVAEPAALLAAGAEHLLVPKQSYTQPGVGRSMTLAVARIPFAARAEQRAPQQGLVIVYTGHGKGKTTAALGLMLRALGRELPVAVVQFIKGKWKTGERLFAESLPQVEFLVMGRGFTWESEDLDRDRQAAAEAWDKAKAMVLSGEYFAVILDEITHAIQLGFIDLADLLQTLRERPPAVHVILTGRNAPAELIARADLVSEMRNIKHPFDLGIKAQPGIDY